MIGDCPTFNHYHKQLNLYKTIFHGIKNKVLTDYDLSQHEKTKHLDKIGKVTYVS